MAETSKIEWTDATWNPVTGCSLVSEGCRHCYAARLAATRLKHHPSRQGLARLNAAGEAKFTGEVRFNEGWLTQPLRWRRPRRIFVCAHGDLFHEHVPDEWIERVFAIMAMAPRHTFQVLTKRPERMRKFVHLTGKRDDVGSWLAAEIAASTDISSRRMLGLATDLIHGTPWPLPNVWLGTSVEDQATAEERVLPLLDTHAAVRFVSAEPLLAPVDLRRLRRKPSQRDQAMPGFDEVEAWWRSALDGQIGIYQPLHPRHQEWWSEPGEIPALDWVIVGGESGPGARPMHPDWARALREQCQDAGVPFFMKQMAKKAPIPTDLLVREWPE